MRSSKQPLLLKVTGFGLFTIIVATFFLFRPLITHATVPHQTIFHKSQFGIRQEHHLAPVTATSFTYPIPLSNTRFTIGYGIQNAGLVGRNRCYWDASTKQYVPFSQLWHAGEDWFATTTAGKTTISAVANGLVEYVSPSTYSYPGGVVIIQHVLADNTIVYSMYGHLDPTKILVSVNQTVSLGQPIASGLIPQKSEGGDNTHLHWEIRYFFDGTGIFQGPGYTQSCSAQPGPGYTWPGQPDNFVFNGTTYQWTNPSQFIANHQQTALTVYIGGYDSYVYAVNANDGSLRWSYKPVYNNSTGSLDTPSVVNGVVYVGSANGTLNALNSSNGSPLWTYLAGGAIVGSPTFANGVIYFGAYDNYFYALNANDGTLLWKFQTGNWISSTPAVVNGVVYFGSWDGNVYALNASNGSLIWQYQTQPGTVGAVVDSPTVVNGIVYVGSNDYFQGSNNYVYALNATSGSFLWKFKVSTRPTDGLAVDTNTIYFGTFSNNIVYALNSSSGSLRWKYHVAGIPSSPTVNSGILYVGSYKNYVYALNTSDGSLRWKYQTQGPNAQPVVGNGILYIGSEDYYEYALNTNSGSLIWRFKTQSWIIDAVTVAP